MASLGNRPVLAHTLGVFQESPGIDSILVITSARLRPTVRKLVAESGFSKVSQVLLGGESRQESVAAGVRALPEECEIVLVHDAARPLLTSALVERCARAARQYGAAMPALPVVDTVVSVDEHGIANTGPDRTHLRTVQTPQAFRASILRMAHAEAAQSAFLATDDASLVRRMGVPVHLVAGERENLKITLPSDLELAETLLNARGAPAPELRIGTGYDVHRLAADCELWLGGVLIPHTHGLVGHSDADVALHALMDALLGAAGLPDIGHLFPNTDPALRGASSLVLLGRVARALSERQLAVVNVDMTILAERPKVAPFIPAMRQKIGPVLGIPSDCIGIKATTHEGVGTVGRHEAIAAHAVALLRRG